MAYGWVLCIAGMYVHEVVHVRGFCGCASHVKDVQVHVNNVKNVQVHCKQHASAHACMRARCIDEALNLSLPPPSMDLQL